MFATFFGNAVAFLLLLRNGYTTPVVEYNKGLRYEEYIVEHEISTVNARNSALTIDVQSIVAPSGCKECTSEEKRYCLGSDFINDHCCCDRRYHEVLPFIPHTCYSGNQLCEPVMECDKYRRLRTCCCDILVLKKWKARFQNSSCKTVGGTAYMIIMIVSSHIVYIFVNYFIT
ncbi:hypothetical protein NQ315_009155 [Exocentrus adspersus]|uniref:CCC domain-containing protein n=1 Tax=Exocentrus adspersus TaxID=1586481 RepID=A0AAV8WGX6_9CUCU|nr:hypothetical protein NQ315_009155 [Exocentrus adspersus]